MSSSKTEQAALSLLKAFENAGQPVSRVVVEGKKIELVLYERKEADEFEGIEMRHGKT
jgi:hypothetical protein